MMHTCSFCHVDANDSYSMVASDDAAICWKCALRCMEIMRDFTAGELEYASWFKVGPVSDGGA